MIWIELSARAEAEAAEAVAELFGTLGYGGVAIEQEPAESLEVGRAELDPSRPVTVRAYLPEDDDAQEKIRRVEEAIWHLSQLRSVEPLRVARLAEEDWAEAWKKFFFVQRIGERLVIKPSWRDYRPGPGEVVLELDPGMAFGTGLHPTTRMCLQACERFVASGMRVLDVGTGSGILAIAAIQLGAASVVALDVDPVAVEVARKNVETNGLGGRVEVLLGSLEKLGARAGFDLVLANITAGAIGGLAGGLHDAVAPGGLVVASGIIDEREGLASDALEIAGLRLEETVAEGDWRTLVVRRGRA